MIKIKVNKAFAVSVLALTIFSCIGQLVFAQSKRVHPRNKWLISKGLAPPSILKFFPEVPKITAQEALALYISKKAVFIAIGHDAPRLPDGWLLLDYMRFNPKKLRLYGIPIKGKYIILYCG